MGEAKENRNENAKNKNKKMKGKEKNTRTDRAELKAFQESKESDIPLAVKQWMRNGERSTRVIDKNSIPSCSFKYK